MQRNLDLDFATFQAGVFQHVIGDVRKEFDPQLLGDDLLRFLFFECPWIITGPVWRRASLLRLGLFDESLPSWQDVDLHIRAIAAGPAMCGSRKSTTICVGRTNRPRRA